MPFKMNNTDGELREDRGSDSKGKRRSSSLERKPWTPPQLALKLRFLALEGANFWSPLILDKDWIEDHLGLAKLHVVMDVDLSRFITIVSERPGQLWAGSSGARWKDFCQCVGFSWAADWEIHLEVRGADSKGNKITWINFHPNPTSCPLNVLSHVQPPLHCMLWRCKLSSIGCLNDELSDDDAEQADDDEDATEEATEVSNPVTSGDVDEDCSMLELAVPSLLSIDSMRILPPYLHLVLGLTNNVVQQMLANLTSLGCVDPTVALRQFEHCALLAELEATVAAAVDELVELLKKEVKKQVTKVVSEMAKVPTPAAPDATSSGVAAPTGAEYVVPGEIAHADWNFLFKRLSKRLNVCETSRKRSLRSGWGRARTAGRVTATATATTAAMKNSPCRFLEKGKKLQINTAGTPKRSALKPKCKWRKWRLRSRRCVGQSWLSRQRRPKAATTTATSTRASG